MPLPAPQQQQPVPTAPAAQPPAAPGKPLVQPQQPPQQVPGWVGDVGSFVRNGIVPKTASVAVYLAKIAGINALALEQEESKLFPEAKSEPSLAGLLSSPTRGGLVYGGLGAAAGGAIGGLFPGIGGAVGAGLGGAAGAGFGYLHRRAVNNHIKQLISDRAAKKDSKRK